MNKLLFACAIIALTLGQLNGQDSVGCFVPGECTNALFLDYTNEAEDAQACLEFCQDTPDCAQFTHFADSNGCNAFANCPAVSTACTDCYSGDATCPDLRCSLPGKCEAAEDDVFENVASSAVCLDLCRSLGTCLWWSYDLDQDLCTLTSECDNVDESCQDCIYGQIACDYPEPENPWEDDDVTRCPRRAFAEPSPDQGLVTCINGGVRDVDIDSFGGTVEISTPGFFEDNLCYQSDMDCRWRIFTSNPDFIIESLGGPHGMETCCDYVTMYNGGEAVGEPYGSYSGAMPTWDPISSTDSEILVRFFTDESEQYKGFAITLTAHEPDL